MAKNLNHLPTLLHPKELKKWSLCNLSDRGND